MPFLVIPTTATPRQGHKVQQEPREVQRILQLLIATAPTDTFIAGKVSLHGRASPEIPGVVEGISTIPTSSDTVRARDRNVPRIFRIGSADTYSKKANRSVSVHGPVCEQNFRDPLKGQFTLHSVQLETVKPVHQEGAFQDGRNDDSEGIGAEAR